MARLLRNTLLTLAAGALVAVAVLAGHVTAQDWRSASREPAGLAPDAASTPEGVVQFYAARTVGIKGIAGVHTWVAVKPSGAREYTVYEIMGWRARRGQSALVIRNRAPDMRWFGAEPELLADRRGAGVDELIRRVDSAARGYPWQEEYTLWPGPNSNTFTAWVARAVPELEVDLPPTAIGKDYAGTRIFGPAPSGSGVQLSLFGLAGLLASTVEGLEVNVLGLTFGINPFDPAIKLPLIGRVGPARAHAKSTAAPAGAQTATDAAGPAASSDQALAAKVASELRSVSDAVSAGGPASVPVIADAPRGRGVPIAVTPPPLSDTTR